MIGTERWLRAKDWMLISASMGPCLDRHGKMIRAARQAPCWEASMGPCLDRHGKRRRAIEACTGGCFNGAVP